MEYAKRGDLLNYIKGPLSEHKSKYIFKQILYGLGHCHCRNIIHRDLKLDNILIGENNIIKICDFGVAKILNSADPIRE